MVTTNAGLRIVAALVIFLAPVFLVVGDLRDPALGAAEIPKAAWRLHRALTPRLERWANARLKSGRARELTTDNISGTEWPLFGAVFYLWATESLQDAWTSKPSLAPVAPKDYAAGAISAAARLVIDPAQAHWVRLHWGSNYLSTENVFYRMLVISALTSHARLTGDRQHLPQLREQVETLSAELDRSPYGLLDDYPHECYPGDVLTAIAMVRRADVVLGTDHSAFVQRALRGFQDGRLSPNGLVPYSADARTGRPLVPSRGCGNSYVSLCAPEIWPEPARLWYDGYARHFWQETWLGAGFREFPKELAGMNWYMDVDAGPVLAGYGFAACAFGVGAARVNGHFEHAFPLAAEMLTAAWPLPGAHLLLPRLLSNAADAPYLGEAAVVFVLTRLPTPGTAVHAGGRVPGLCYVGLALQSLVGLALLGHAARTLRRLRRGEAPVEPPALRLQLWLWGGLLASAVVAAVLGWLSLALVAFLLSQLLPRGRRAAVPSAGASLR